MTKAKKPAAQKSVEAAESTPDAEVVQETRAKPEVPGEDATADELSYFIHHNPVYWTLLPDERNALKERFIEAKRQA